MFLALLSLKTPLKHLTLTYICYSSTLKHAKVLEKLTDLQRLCWAHSSKRLFKTDWTALFAAKNPTTSWHAYFFTFIVLLFSSVLAARKQLCALEFPLCFLSPQIDSRMGRAFIPVLITLLNTLIFRTNYRRAKQRIMEQARSTTEQLRAEASIQRKKVSEVAKE